MNSRLGGEKWKAELRVRGHANEQCCTLGRYCTDGCLWLRMCKAAVTMLLPQRETALYSY